MESHGIWRAQTSTNPACGTNGYCSLAENSRAEAAIVWSSTVRKLLLSPKMPPLTDKTLCHRMLTWNIDRPPYTNMHVGVVRNFLPFTFSFLEELQLYYKTKREDRVQFTGCLCRISQHSAAHAFLSIVKPNSSYILA